MSKLNQLTRFLNKEFKIKKIPDHSKNGLQVKGKKNIRKIALGVDASLELFKKAKQKKCDLIIVHHGLFWEKQKDPLNIIKNRVDFLKKNKISLFVIHLPLDKHLKYGNNVEIARLISLKKFKSFANHKGVYVGIYGDYNKNIRTLIKTIKNKINKSSKIQLFGPKKPKKVGIISGGGISHIYDCKRKEIDTFITGEPKHLYFHFAKELRLNMVFAGHYKTEILGIKSLQKLIKQKFNIETVLIDIPTGL
jgi:dinuclear metal center YbgI/SA1388 family protein